MRKCNWTIKGKQTFGYFHQYGLNAGGNPDGYVVNYTEAIVEDKIGNVHFVPVDSIQFIPDDFVNEDFISHKSVYGF